jgi:hypothetical protein
VIALATAAAWPLYETPRVAVVAGVAALLGIGAAVVGWLFSWRWWMTGLLAFTGYVVAVVPVAIPSAMTDPARIARGITQGVTGVVLAWKQLLTISLPAGDYQGVLVPFFIAVLVGSLAATALILHGGRWSPLAVVPMLLMVLFGAVFGRSTTADSTRLGPFTVPAPSHVLVASLAVIVCIAWLLIRARVERAEAIGAARSRTGTATLGSSSAGHVLRRYLLASALVASTLVGALVLAPLATSWGPRQVPRDEIDPLLVLQRQPSPLMGYRESFEGDNHDAVLFTVANPGTADRVRIATLNAYDGEVFYVDPNAESARFSRQPMVQQPTMTITVGEGYSGVWVPLTTSHGGAPQFLGDRAQELTDAYYASTDLNAGVLASDSLSGEAADAGQALQPGDSFRISSVASAPAEQITSASGGAAIVSEEDYPAMAAWVELQDLGRSGGDLIELVDRLRARGYLSHSTRQGDHTADWVGALDSRANYTFVGSRSGHSGARIDELFAALVDQQRRAGAGANDQALVAAPGDDEQFATAAALLAQYLGFESRVVIGVRLGSESADLGVPPCIDTCTGGNLTAWVEVRAAGQDWVTLDATPQFESTPLLIEEGQTPPENPTQPDQVASEVIEPGNSASESSSTSPAQEEEVEQTWLEKYLPVVVAVATIVIGAGLVMLPLLIFPVAKAARRRWRRRAPVPEVAMVGAWHELIDNYVDLGIPVPVALTRAETADVVEREAAALVADAVDRAVFSEHPPTRESSNEAWSIVDGERKAVSAQVPFGRRVKATFAPTSLLRTLRAHSSTTTSTLRRKDRHDRPL